MVHGWFQTTPQATPLERAILLTQLAAATLMLQLCGGRALDGFRDCLAMAGGRSDAVQILTALTRFLDDCGVPRSLTDTEAHAIAEDEQLFAEGGRSFTVAALGLLGLSNRASADDRRRAFEQLAVPLMSRAAAAQDVCLILMIEAACYTNHIKTIETPEHHTAAFSAVEKAYEPLAYQPASTTRASPGAAPRLAFLIPNGRILAHSEVLLAFLAGLKALPFAPIDPVVLIHSADDGGELGGRLDQLGVAWDCVGRPRDYAIHFDLVRAKLDRLGIDGVVVVSLPLFLPFFMRRPLSAVQIWWSMKFALPNFPGLTGRVFYRSLFDRKVEIAGREWRGGPLAFTPPPPPNPKAVEAIRARYPGKTILGTVAREEKIANEDYLSAVVDILRRRPETVFLWTGRNQLRQITEAFAAGGVADRCHFMGWVEPTRFIGAFDLFLETYPLTGLMSGWAMALGKPIVSVGPLGFLATYLEPIMNGTIEAEPGDLARLDDIFRPVRDALPGLWAPHPRDMGAMVDKLLDEPALRAEFGDVQRRYVQAFMNDEAASAAIQAHHFAAIVEEQRVLGRS